MKLSPEEERLIKSLRELDHKNPAGVDGYSEANILPTLQRIVDGLIPNAARRYKLFLKQSKGKVIDLQEAQRPKFAEDDPRSNPSCWG